jgi:hypothetical protein
MNSLCAFCSGCLQKHVAERPSATHVVSDWAPDGCWGCGQPPELVCRCVDPGLELCGACFSVHCEGEVRSHRVECLPDPESLSLSFPLLSDRMRRIQFLRSQLSLSIDSLEEFKKNTRFETENLRNAIEKHFGEVNEDVFRAEVYLKTIAEDIEKCKNDAETSENAVMQKYGLQIAKGKTLKVFEAEIDLDQGLGAIRNLAVLSLKIEKFKSEPRICFFKPRSREVTVVDMTTWTSTKKQFSKGLALKDSGSWCDLPSGSVFFCGGVQSPSFAKDAFIIDPRSLSLVRLPEMQDARALCALGYHKGCVYVFGGYAGKNLNTCERFELKREKWSRIADMPIARSAFSAVVYAGSFYRVLGC